MTEHGKHFTKLALFAALFCLVAAFALAACGGGSNEPEAEDESEAIAPAAEEVTTPLPTEPFYVLLVGNDSRTGTVEAGKPEYADGAGRSDTIMLLRVDPALYSLTIVTVPRDTAAEVDGYWGKINAAYRHHGIEGLQQKIEELTGVSPKYYIDLGFVSFEGFIDQMGGVTANVPVDLSMQDIVSGEYIYLGAGEQTLNGPEALVLARSRKVFYENQDALRQISDRAIVESLIRYVASNPGIAEAAVSTLTTFAGTNWSQDEMLALVKDFCDHANEISIISGTGPYYGYIDDNVGEWLVPYDPDTWHQLMALVSDGGDPNTMVSVPAFPY